MDDPTAGELLQHGLNALNQGQFDEALSCARRVVADRPDMPDAHFLAGLALQRVADDNGAITAFDAVARLTPQNPAASAHRAESLLRLGRYDEAEAALARAAQLDDGNPVVRQVIAMTWSALGDHDKALPWFARSAKAQPSNPGLLLNLANCQLFLGQLDEAETSLREALRLQPLMPNAHWLLARVRKAGDRAHIDEMTRLLASGKYPPQAAAFLHYARGKEFEDLEAWDEAFDAYAAGAAAVNATQAYDEQAEIAVFAAAEQRFTREWLAAGPAGSDDTSPIFVLGQPRSGTTLVERILSAHSQVHSAGELRQFGDVLARLTGYRGQARYALEVIEAATSIDPGDIGRDYLAAAKFFGRKAARFVDKQPGNFLYLPLILKALPGGKLVHLRRGAMDTCFSAFKQLFTGAYPYSYDLATTGRHFARYARLMDCWRERFGEWIYEVRYEELAADVDTGARALIDAVDLPWEDSCADFHRQDAPVATASAAQVREAAHTRSVGRWRCYETQLAPLREVLEAEGLPLD